MTARSQRLLGGTSPHLSTMYSSSKPRRAIAVAGESACVAVDDANHSQALVPRVPDSPDKATAVQSAVKLSLTNGAFIDTKLWAYSRRRPDGVVDRPRPLYANTAILKASSRIFEACKLFQHNSVSMSDLHPRSARGQKQKCQVFVSRRPRPSEHGHQYGRIRLLV